MEWIIFDLRITLDFKLAVRCHASAEKTFKRVTLLYVSHFQSQSLVTRFPHFFGLPDFR